MPVYERRPSSPWGWLAGALAIGFVLFVIAAILYPAYVHNPGTPQRSSCMNNLKQIGTAINMYMQDNDERFPLVSGFGPELDRHTALWGAEGTVFNRRGNDVKYMRDVIYPYVKNRTIFVCPLMRKGGMVWKVPGGEVDFGKNVTTYIFNAWYLKKPGSKDPRDRVEVAGQKAITCALPAEAPLVWDGISGYAANKVGGAQLAHGDSFNVLYVDGHTKGVQIDPDMPPYNRARGMDSHFWGAECRDPGVTTTQGARGWWYTLSEVK